MLKLKERKDFIKYFNSKKELNSVLFLTNDLIYGKDYITKAKDLFKIHDFIAVLQTWSSLNMLGFTILSKYTDMKVVNLSSYDVKDLDGKYIMYDTKVLKKIIEEIKLKIFEIMLE